MTGAALKCRLRAQTLVSSYFQPRYLLRASWRVQRGMPFCKHILPSSEHFLPLGNNKAFPLNLSSFVRHSKAVRNREDTWESFYLVINSDSDHPCMIAQLAWERAGCFYMGFLCWVDTCLSTQWRPLPLVMLLADAWFGRTWETGNSPIDPRHKI